MPSVTIIDLMIMAGPAPPAPEAPLLPPPTITVNNSYVGVVENSALGMGG